MDTAAIALGLIANLRNSTRHALLAHFGSAEAVLKADEEALTAFKGVGTTLAARIRSVDLAAFERTLAAWQRRGVHVLPHGSAHYPALLMELPDAPAVLFALGLLPNNTWWQQAAAVVGTREPLPRSRQLAHFFASRYAVRGYTVLSGLALGIDRAAHEGALHEGGRTVAVLGSGVLNVYPALNAQLAQRIASTGALLCECAPDAPVSAARLVARNRLISGLAQQLLLIESAEDGGAMHAVRFAFAQGRSVLALNLPAGGNQAAIAAGAQAVTV